MNVMLVSHRMPPDAVAGVERYTQSLARELLSRGDAVSVVTRRPGRHDQLPHVIGEDLDPDLGGRLFRIAGGDTSRDRFTFTAIHRRMERLFENLLVEMAPDVVHFNHVIDLSPRFIEIALRLRSAVVLSLHDFFFACPRIILRRPTGELCAGPEGGRACGRCGCLGETPAREVELRTMYYRRLLSAPQYVVCPSNYVAEYFRQWTGRRADQILAVPNGIVLPPALTNGNGWRPPKGRSLRLAFLGSVTEHKGVHVILEAAALSATPLELDVYGPADPHYARQLRARAMTIPHLQLRLHGAYEPSQLSSMLHDIDCVVAPSQWPETFLLVTREAMARGVPVIVSRLGALPDAVCEGQNGFSFTHDRPEELAALLDRVTTDTGLLPALRKNARETRILSVAEHTEIVRGIYRRAMTDLAAGGGGTAGGDLAELDVIYQCLSGDREGVAC